MTRNMSSMVLGQHGLQAHGHDRQTLVLSKLCEAGREAARDAICDRIDGFFYDASSKPVEDLLFNCSPTSAVYISGLRTRS